ncbi:MAG: hypothetical protein GTO14_11260 [Anaerolineales bacterium]|nr:hypothetical protein [Anaerolineales bacterium]
MCQIKTNRQILIAPLVFFLAALACNMPGSAQPTKPPPIDTEAPMPNSSPIPPTPTQKPSPWERVSGTWSGCLTSFPPSSPDTLTACTDPRGSFITLYMLPTCAVGEHCGNYVKGAFESEFILLKLTLLEFEGDKIKMYGDAGTGMFEWASTDVEIERVGAEVLISEATGESYFLPSGCDPIIDQQTTIGCYEYLP